MPLRDLFNAVGTCWNACINKVSKAVLRPLGKFQLRKMVSELTALREDAIRLRSEFSEGLKRVSDIILVCGCGGIANDIRIRSGGKVDNRHRRLTWAVPVNTVLDGDSFKCEQDAKVYRSTIRGSCRPEQGCTDEELKHRAHCTICARNQVVAGNLYVALVEINEVMKWCDALVKI